MILLECVYYVWLCVCRETPKTKKQNWVSLLLTILPVGHGSINLVYQSPRCVSQPLLDSALKGLSINPAFWDAFFQHCEKSGLSGYLFPDC